MFRFRLEALLRIRRNERDERRADLAKALRAEQVLRGELERLRGEQREATVRSRQLKGPGAADVDALLSAHRHEVVLAAQQRQVATQLTQVEAECERRRQALVESDRQVRVLEKLRERQAAEYQQQAERQAGKEMDEMGVLQFIREQESEPTRLEANA